MSVSITNVINVSLSSVTTSLNTPSVNSLALFTTEQPNNVDTYNIYYNASDVGSAYGTSSVAYQMAVNIFSQSPGLLAGNGQLITIPYTPTTTQTAGYTQTIDLSPNLSNLIAVSDGSFAIDVDGTTTQISGIDLTSATTVNNIATLLQTVLTGLGVTVSSTSNIIQFTSDSLGTSSSVVLSTGTGGGTDLTGSSYLDIAAATVVQGTSTTTMDATAGSSTTPDISSNLANLITIFDGYIAVILNGNTIQLSNLDFTNCVTLADVATILQNNLTDVIVAATSTQISFTSKKVGSSSSVVLTAGSGTGTDLSLVNYLDTVDSTQITGTNSVGETLVEAIARTQDVVSYVGVITDLQMEDSAIQNTATTIQALDMIFLHQVASTEDIAGIGTTISAAGDTQTRLLLYTTSLTDGNLFKAAYAGRAFSCDFTGVNTTFTMNLKQLTNVTGDEGITDTILAQAQTAGLDMYPVISNYGWVISTGGNDYFDNVYNSMWLALALETAGFNYLATTSTKIPQTEAGMYGLKGAYRGVLDQGVINGMIGTGLTWNSPNTFGNQTLFQNNITDYGYYIYSTPISQQSQTEREARQAPLVQIAVKLGGAIQSSNVLVFVEQ